MKTKKFVVGLFLGAGLKMDKGQLRRFWTIYLGLVVLVLMFLVPLTSPQGDEYVRERVNYETNEKMVSYRNITILAPYEIVCSWSNASSLWKECEVIIEIENSDIIHDYIEKDIPLSKFKHEIQDIAIYTSTTYKWINVTITNLSCDDFLNLSCYYNVSKRSFEDWKLKTKLDKVPKGGVLGVKLEFKSPMLVDAGIYLRNHFNFTMFGEYNVTLDPTISECMVLSTAGATYTMNASILNSSTSNCMNILNDSIVLDCNGYTIDGDDVAIRGITISKDPNINVTVRNCIVTDWNSDAIYVYKASRSFFENLFLDSNPSTGIYLDRVSYINLTNITSVNNAYGVYTYHGSPINFTNITSNNNEYGLFTNFNFDNNIIQNSKFENNSISGILFNSGVEGDPNNNLIYNNFFNNTYNFNSTEIDLSINFWNTSKQIGNRVYSAGTWIGGNYWANKTGDGYSDTCIDSNYDGFCDDYYNLTRIGGETQQIDWLPLSNEFLPPLLTWKDLTNNASTTTRTNGNVSFGINLSDDVGLSAFILMTNKTGGALTNETTVMISGTPTKFTANYSVIVTATHISICGAFWFNDTSNNINVSDFSCFYVQNSPPTTPTTLSPSSGNITSNTQQLTCSGSADADSDPVRYEFYGDTSTTPTTLLQNTTSTTYDWTFTSGNTYYFRCRAHDGNDTSGYTSTNWLYVDYMTPTIPSITNNGSNARTGWVVNWTGTVSDDRQLAKYRLETNDSGTWTNESLQTTSGTTTNFDLSKTISSTRGMYVCGRVWVNDTSNFANESSNSCFTVANTPPTHTTPILNFSGSTNTTTENLQCFNQSFVDADNDGLTANYRWFNDSGLIGGQTTSTLGNSITIKHWNYTCEVTPNDGYDDGTSLNSTALKVLNAVPTHTAPIINTSSATNYTNETVQCFNQSFADTDNDPVTANYRWFNDSGLISGQTTSSIASSITIKHWNYTCEVRPYDGEQYGSRLNSTSLEIRNYPPTFDESLPDQTVASGSNLYLDANASDIDLDTITWAVNDSRVSIDSNGVITDSPVVGDIGTHTINVSANDKETNTSTTFTYTVTDGIKPTWSNNKSNASGIKVSQWAYFNITLNDDVQGSFYLFSFYNGTSWSNSSWTSWTTPKEVTQVLQNNATRGQTLSWYWRFNDSSNNFNETNTWSTTVANTVPSVASATINNSNPVDTDDLQCDNGSTSDADSDIVSLFYDWLKNDVGQGVNNKVLLNGNTSVGEQWKCNITPSDTYGNGTSVFSASVSIGTSFIAPIINYTNSTTTITNVISDTSNPTKNNSWVNLSVYIYDSNIGELHTAYFCKDNIPPSATGCSNSWCNSSSNISGPVLSCKYTISNLSTTLYDYYVFVVDNSSLTSSITQNNFSVNHPPTVPSLNTPINASWINTDWVNLTYSAVTDSDGDTINYTVFGNYSTSTMPLIYNGNTTSFNWSGLLELNYSWSVQAMDEHSYVGENSSIRIFYVDQTIPSSIVISPSVGQDFSSQDAIPLQFSAVDTNRDTCFYDVIYSSTSAVHTTNTSTNCTNTTFDVTAWASFVLGFYVNDSATNINSTRRNFSVTQPSATGGGGTPTTIKIINVTEETLLEVTCGNGVCDRNEDPLKCWQDCKINWDTALCTEGIECIRNQAWFFNWVLIGMFGIIMYATYRGVKRKVERKKKKSKKKT